MSRGDIRKAVAKQQYGKPAKLGSGARFAALKNAIAAKGNVEDPAALDVSIGRKKYGTQRFSRLSVAAKKRGN